MLLRQCIQRLTTQRLHALNRHKVVLSNQSSALLSLRNFNTKSPPPPPPPTKENNNDKRTTENENEVNNTTNNNNNSSDKDIRKEEVPPTQEETIKELEKKIADLAKERDEAKDQMLRSYAEQENVRQRTKNEIESAKIYANQKFAKSLLDIADNLTRALESVPKEELEKEENKTLKVLNEGIIIVENDLQKVFKSNGIVAFGEVGDNFDPQSHEAMMTMPSEELAPGTVGMVMAKGYRFKDRVIRPAQVGTVKQP